MKYISMTALALAIGLASQTAMAETYTEGKDYTVLKNPENIKGDIIVVREFFWYGCSHCYKLEPYIEKWKKTKAKDVAFFHTPAALNPVWENSARGFYAAQLLGYQDKTHKKIFDDIFKTAQINQELAGSSRKAITNWYTSQGIDSKKFEGALDSFVVNTKIARSQAAAKRYQISGTPTVVVQGKYVVKGDNEKVPAVIDYLVDKVRKENAAKQ